MTVRIGIADDDPEIRSALADLVGMDPDLELAGQAADAVGAVSVAEEHRPDVFLVDVRMPGGGPEATRGIRSVSPKTRVIAFSAYDDRTTVLEMLRSGAVSYVTKGSGAGEILDAVTRAMEGQSVLSPAVSGEVVQELGVRLRTQEHHERRRRETVDRVQRILQTAGGLSLVYQPIFDVHTGEVVGAEALSRFSLPPPRPPDQWFRDAADVGMANVLETAAAGAALGGLAELPRGAHVAINVSPDTVMDPMFARLLDAAPVGHVVLEVTEHAPVRDYGRLAAALDPLRERGLRLAVDDAGSGYAGLRHILRLAPDILKLDIDLTRGISTDRARHAMSVALIRFAEEMDMTVVAEGIETDQELEALRELGVPWGQGYLLGRPGPLPLAVATAS
ncbi:MAG TPA: EAL domain-containing protein [Actinomycetota bacterium]|nr:EAL domain-containing protein [Actinomycetota bacterium]